MKPQSPVRQRGLAWTAACLLFLCSTVPRAAAQDPPPEESAPLRPGQGGWMYHQKNGQVLRPDQVGLDPRLLEQLNQRTLTQLSVSTYDISSIQATGTVSGNVATIDAEFLVVLKVDQEWVRVPLDLPSWTCQDFQYESDVPNAEHEFTGNTTRRHEWFLRGRGAHRLKLTLVGEVRSAPGDRSELKLSVPSAIISRLDLTFDRPVDDVRSNLQTSPWVRRTPEQTSVSLSGLGRDTRISWQSVATTAEAATVLQMTEPAEMTLDLTASPAILTSIQTLEISGRPLESVTVRMPPGFSDPVIRGWDKEGRSVVSHQALNTASPESEDPSLVTIPLTRAVTGSLRLRFDLGLDSRDDITVRIPDFEGVSEEKARLQIQRPQGLDVFPEAGILTRRIQVDEPSGPNDVATAYRLTSPMASLQLSVRTLEARYTVEPHLTLELSRDSRRLVMHARFPVNVNRGALNELFVEWKNRDQDGWKIQPGTLELKDQANVTRRLTAEPDSEDTTRLPLGDFQSGRFEVSFQALRSLEPDGTNAPVFYLPDVRATTPHQTLVSLVETDSHLLSLTADDGKSTFTMTPSQFLDGKPDQERVTTWQVSVSGSAVQVHQSLQTQEINSTALVVLEPQPVQKSIHVHTILSVNVRHRDPTELRLKVPPGALATVRLDGQNSPLTSSQTVGNETIWALPKGTRRQFDVLIDYVWPASESVLPLVLPTQQLDSLMIGTTSPHMVRLADSVPLRAVHPQQFAAAWYTDRFDAEWYTEKPFAEIPLQIAPQLRSHFNPAPAVVCVSSQVDAAFVTTTTTAIYQHVPQDVVFHGSNEMLRIATHINGQPVLPVTEEQTDPDAIPVWRVSLAGVPRDKPVRVSLTTRVYRSPHHHLLSRVSAGYATIDGVPAGLTTIWTIQGEPWRQLMSLDRSQTSSLRASTWQNLLTPDAQDPQLTAVLNGFPREIRELASRELQQSDSGSNLCFVAGADLQQVSLLSCSRSLGLLVIAGTGILLYVLLVSADGRMQTALLVIVPGSLMAWALLPQQAGDLLIPMVPAAVLAVIAWLVRRRVSGPRRRFRQRAAHTVFTSVARRSSHLHAVSDSASPTSVRSARPSAS